MSNESETEQVGRELHEFCSALYPICRSITGNGVRETLAALDEWVPVEVTEVPSGSRVFDWVVPDEWNCEEAFIEDAAGNRVVDFADHNLHLMSYSVPVDRQLPLEELQRHLHSLPEQPELIPYRTSYYAPNWGFCLSHHCRQQLKPGSYRVRIDSQLAAGSLTYGEVFIPGRTDQELLISAHICHPSLANDNLSGISVAAALARHYLDQQPLHYGLRFVFVPSTIGAITWLASNPEKTARTVAGLVLSGVGDAGGFTFKHSKKGDGLIDRILPGLMQDLGLNHEVRSFMPYGYDERQYCSPGLNLAVGCLMRTPYGEYPEYHTSGDNLDLIQPNKLGETFDLVRRALDLAQCCRSYVNLAPNCEPQLGRRGLYDAIGGDNDTKTAQMALLWMLSSSDGNTSTLDISQESGIPLEQLCLAAERLCDAELLSPAHHGNSA
ncbi:MAG: DUF4910 domain-containing protein [Xanthomonadales bacterium]|nr:DUF4910 domain-containing protein [Xanthomonadales bacterium]